MESIREVNLEGLLQTVESWFQTHVLAFDNAIQLGLVALALLIGRWLGSRLRAMATSTSQRLAWRAEFQAAASHLADFSTPAAVLLLLWTAAEVGARRICSDIS